MTNTNLTLFKFKDHAVCVVIVDGAPWWVAKDVLTALGYAAGGHGVAMRKLSEDESTLYSIKKGRRSQRVVSKSGLFKLIMRSDKKEATEFQNWVTKVVLPAIDEDGGYIHGEEHVVSGAMTEDELVFKAMEVMKLPTSQTSGTPPVTFITESGLALEKEKGHGVRLP